MLPLYILGGIIFLLCGYISYKISYNENEEIPKWVSWTFYILSTIFVAGCVIKIINF